MTPHPAPNTRASLRRCRRALAGLWLLLLAVAAAAAEPPSTPLLRIEAGAHTAMIRRVAVDAAGRYALTASDDKSARLYDLADGALLRTLRPPIGPGDEGKLFAAALSPDGAIAALAGFTQFNNGSNAVAADGQTIYLFDAASGRLRRRIDGLGNVIGHLAFSADGRRLAATLGGGQGLRVFRVRDGAELGRDSAYGGASYSAHFATDGRLLTTCQDGQLRLYDANLKLLAKRPAPGGKDPCAARFAPDGKGVAVGYQDSTRVDVLSGRDLSFLFSADTAGVANGSFDSVAWSADGRALYASGRYRQGSQRPIRRWHEGGRGPGRDLRVGAGDTVMDLAPLPGGGVLFGAADPALGVLRADGTARLLARPPVADFRGNLQKNLRVSADGGSVRFRYKPDEKSYARFSCANRRLQLGPGPAGALAPPRTSAPGLEVNGWKNTYKPKLNGATLALKRYEMSRCLAVAPNGQSLVLGTNWYLRRFGRDGQQLWRIPAPGTVRGVNICADGKLLVAAYADGTLRWHRLSDGRELLAFFPHGDRKRWVAWTPSGYYDASPGGEDLIGWHRNRGRDRAADFYGAARFRERFYRPDIVAAVLPARDEAVAIAQADAAAGRRRNQAKVAEMLPPVVSLLAPAPGSRVSDTRVTLRYALRAPADAPVTGLRVLVDGRPVSQQRGVRLQAREGEHSLSVTIPQRDCEVSLIAENRHAASEPAAVRLRWAGQPARAFVAKPKLYLLAVGVGAYRDPELKLRYPAKDARDFAACLQRQQGHLYREVVVKTLTDTQAGKGDILDGLDWLERQTTSRDVGMIFLAGHGVDDASGTYYFLPHNADPERLKRTGLAFFDLESTLKNLAGKALLFADTCHAGDIMGARRGGADINAVVNELASAENGSVVFASSTGRQYSLEDAAWGNGAFTKALVEGLGGKADYTGSGRITVNMLDLYLAERVKQLTGGRQTPTTTKPHTVPDFPLAVH